MGAVLLLALGMVPESGEAGAGASEAESLLETVAYPGGLRLCCFADGSQAQNPVALSFDDQGRLYLAETPWRRKGAEDLCSHADGLLEDLALRSTGERLALYGRLAERGVVPANAWRKAADRIRLVTDQDGDGRADHGHFFADGFDDVLDGVGRGILPGAGGSFYANPPHLWWLADEDADGVSEGQTPLLEGFGVRIGCGAHDMRGLLRGPDGRIYWAVGDRGYGVQSSEGKRLSNPWAGAVFRCEPDGSRLEVVHEGLRHPAGLAFDACGDLFTVDDGSDAWDEPRLVAVREGGDSGWQAGHQVLLQFSEAWGLRTLVLRDARDGKMRPLTSWLAEGLCVPAHAEQPAWVLPPVGNVGWAPHSLVFNYGGTALPAEFRDGFLLGNGAGARSDLEWFFVERAGAGYVLRDRRPTWVTGAASTAMEFGPDGKLYLCSSHKFEWSEQASGSVLTLSAPERESGAVLAEARRFLVEPLGGKSSVELADWLSHEDMRVRLRAQFELARRGEESVVLLEGALQQRLRLPRRLHGIWGLGQIARATGGSRAMRVLTVAAMDGDAEVRAQVAKALGEGSDERSGRVLLSLLRDESARVRGFACLGVRRRGLREAVPELVRVLEENGDADAYLRQAAAVALGALAQEGELAGLARHGSAAVRRGAVVALRRQRAAGLQSFLADPDPSIVREAVGAICDLDVEAALPGAALVLEKVAGMGLGEMRDWLHHVRLIHANWRVGTDDSAQRLAEYACRVDVPDALRHQALLALEHWKTVPAVDPVVGLPRSFAVEGRVPQEAVCRAAVTRLMVVARGELLATAIRLARQVEMELSLPLLKGLLVDPRVGEPARAELVTELLHRKAAGLKEICRVLLGDGQFQVRRAALRALLELDVSQGVQAAKGMLESGLARDRQEAVRALAGCGDARAAAEWQALLRGEGGAGKDAAILLELAECRELGGPEEGEPEGEPGEQPADEFAACVAGGDPVRGERVFASHAAGRCSHCHRVGQGRWRAGPDLTMVGSRLRAREILDALIRRGGHGAPGSSWTLVKLADGSFAAGSLLRETEDRLVLRPREGGGEREILKSALVARTVPTPEMLPMGELVTKRDLRDLVAYLSGLRGGAD